VHSSHEDPSEFVTDRATGAEDRHHLMNPGLEAPGLVVAEGLFDFFSRVHHEGTVARDRLVERIPASTSASNPFVPAVRSSAAGAFPISATRWSPSGVSAICPSPSIACTIAFERARSESVVVRRPRV